MYNSLAPSKCNDRFVSSRQQHLNTKSLKLCMKVWKHAAAKMRVFWFVYLYDLYIYFLPHHVHSLRLGGGICTWMRSE